MPLIATHSVSSPRECPIIMVLTPFLQHHYFSVMIHIWTASSPPITTNLLPVKPDEYRPWPGWPTCSFCLAGFGPVWSSISLGMKAQSWHQPAEAPFMIFRPILGWSSLTPTLDQNQLVFYCRCGHFLHFTLQPLFWTVMPVTLSSGRRLKYVVRIYQSTFQWWSGWNSLDLTIHPNDVYLPLSPATSDGWGCIPLPLHWQKAALTLKNFKALTRIGVVPTPM